jgi:hypothetical protein
MAGQVANEGGPSYIAARHPWWVFWKVKMMNKLIKN